MQTIQSVQTHLVQVAFIAEVSLGHVEHGIRIATNTNKSTVAWQRPRTDLVHVRQIDLIHFHSHEPSDWWATFWFGNVASWWTMDRGVVIFFILIGVCVFLFLTLVIMDRCCYKRRSSDHKDDPEAPPICRRHIEETNGYHPSTGHPDNLHQSDPNLSWPNWKLRSHLWPFETSDHNYVNVKIQKWFIRSKLSSWHNIAILYYIHPWVCVNCRQVSCIVVKSVWRFFGQLGRSRDRKSGSFGSLSPRLRIQVQHFILWFFFSI
jgi:hypothetical protein